MEYNIKIPSDALERELATDPTISAIVNADAGAGKTSILINRYMRALLTVDAPESILCITYTNKAAAEITSRIIETLNMAKESCPQSPHKRKLWNLAVEVDKHSREKDWNLDSNPNRINVMTFDAFNNKLAHKMPLLSQIGGPANVEENTKILYQEAVQSLFSECHDLNLDSKVRDSILSLLKFSGNQYERLYPKMIELLSTRDQWSHYLNNTENDSMSLSIQYFIKSRLNIATKYFKSNGIDNDLIITMKSASCNEQMSWANGIINMPSDTCDDLAVWKNIALTMLTKSNRYLKKIVNAKDGFPAKQNYTVKMNTLLSSLHESGKAKQLSKILSDIIDLPNPDYPVAIEEFKTKITYALLRLIAHLQVVFESHGKLDFVEVGTRAIRALGNGNDYTDVLVNVIDYKIKHILVDEFQDTNINQLELLGLMTSGWEPGDGRTLFLVGDPKQSIYRFRQAMVRLFLQIWDNGEFNDIKLKKIKLKENFRSDIIPVEFCNRTLSQIFPDENDMYVSAVSFDKSVAFNDEGIGSATIHPFLGKNEAREAEIVSDIIRDSLHNNPDQSIAVLVRNRAHLQSLIPKLKERGILYTATNIDPIVKRTAVVNYLHLVKACRHRMDRQAWVGLLRARFVGLTFADVLTVCIAAGKDGDILSGIYKSLEGGNLSEDGMHRLSRLLQAFEKVDIDASQSDNLLQKSASIWRDLGGHLTCNTEELQDVFTLTRKLQNYSDGGKIIDMPALLASLSNIYATPISSNVNLMTLHSSKGLEFDRVIIMGMGRGPGGNNDEPILTHTTTPNGFIVAPNPGKKCASDAPEKLLFNALKSIDQSAADEETKRLIYTGMTRARSHLHLVGHINNNSKEIAPYSRSLFYYLWPAIENDCKRIIDMEPNDFSSRTNNNDIIVTPCISRLATIGQNTSIENIYTPKRSITRIPSEQSINYEIYKNRDNSYHRYIGIVYHQILMTYSSYLFKTHKLPITDDQVIARLSKVGISNNMIQKGLSEIQILISNTIDDHQGRWILAPRSYEKYEWKISSFMENQWVSAVIDKLFIEDNHLHLVDYKSTGVLQGDNNTNVSINSAVEQYRKQMTDYLKLLQQHFNLPISAHLYFPYYKHLHTYNDLDAAENQYNKCSNL